MSINTASMDIPQTKVSYGTCEKALATDKKFFDRIKDNPNEFSVHAEGWLKELFGVTEKMGARMEVMCDTEKKQLEVWQGLNALIEKDEFCFFNSERSAIILKELEAYIQKREAVEKLYDVETGYRKKRLALQKEVLLKLKKIAQ